MPMMNTPLINNNPAGSAASDHSVNNLKNSDFNEGDPIHKQREFHQLRRDIAVLDGRHVRPRISLGIESLDSALAGGLALGRVHMLRAASARSHGALTGFAICVLRQ